MFWHAQLTAYAAHFIFEQKAERFAKFQIHLFGQTAYIVMAFNHRTCDRQGFDAVGVNGTLCQPLHVFNLVSFFIEYVDKSFADDFTFAFRFGYACQFGKELFAGVYADNVQSEAFVIMKHIAEFVFAKHAVVDEDTSQVFADSFVEQYGCNR